MAVFVIFRVGNPPLMRKLLQENFPNDHLEIKGDQWLVSAAGSAKSLSERLQAAAPNQLYGNAIIFRMSSYWGHAPTEVWEWIYDKMKANNGK